MPFSSATLEDVSSNGNSAAPVPHPKAKAKRSKKRRPGGEDEVVQSKRVAFLRPAERITALKSVRRGSSGSSAGRRCSLSWAKPQDRIQKNLSGLWGLVSTGWLTSGTSAGISVCFQAGKQGPPAPPSSWGCLKIKWNPLV